LREELKNLLQTAESKNEFSELKTALLDIRELFHRIKDKDLGLFDDELIRMNKEWDRLGGLDSENFGEVVAEEIEEDMRENEINANDLSDEDKKKLQDLKGKNFSLDQSKDARKSFAKLFEEKRAEKELEGIFEEARNAKKEEDKARVFVKMTQFINGSEAQRKVTQLRENEIRDYLENWKNYQQILDEPNDSQFSLRDKIFMGIGVALVVCLIGVIVSYLSRSRRVSRR